MVRFSTRWTLVGLAVALLLAAGCVKEPSGISDEPSAANTALMADAYYSEITAMRETAANHGAIEVYWLAFPGIGVKVYKDAADGKGDAVAALILENGPWKEELWYSMMVPGNFANGIATAQPAKSALMKRALRSVAAQRKDRTSREWAAIALIDDDPAAAREILLAEYAKVDFDSDQIPVPDEVRKAGLRFYTVPKPMVGAFLRSLGVRVPDEAFSPLALENTVYGDGSDIADAPAPFRNPASVMRYLETEKDIEHLRRPLRDGANMYNRKLRAMLDAGKFDELKALAPDSTNPVELCEPTPQLRRLAWGCFIEAYRELQSKPGQVMPSSFPASRPAIDE